MRGYSLAEYRWVNGTGSGLPASRSPRPSLTAGCNSPVSSWSPPISFVSALSSPAPRAAPPASHAIRSETSRSSRRKKPAGGGVSLSNHTEAQELLDLYLPISDTFFLSLLESLTSGWLFRAKE